MSVTPADEPQAGDSTIRFAGIGDEAGASLPNQVGSLVRLGWTSIELRTVGDTAVADLDDDTFAELASTLQASGFAVVCIGSRIGNWARPISNDFSDDLRELAVLERRCAALGTRFVRVMSYPNDGLSEQEWRRQVVERMRLLADRAEQAGLVLVHENCAGWAGTRPERMLALLEAVDSPALRLLFDTGNGTAHRYDAYDLLTHIVEHVAHVHIKDARGDAADPVYTLPGAGRARVADCLRLLLDSGFTGTWSIEPHLALQPHLAGASEAPTDTDQGGVDRGDSFVASGQALERLVRDQVLPRCPEWTADAGGLEHRGAR